ncbi:hypothetical protein KR026_003894 [Drosophila bipectinata]|nr:hypothetical protein KR026_003894 [Drosophila bipectinata]
MGSNGKMVLDFTGKVVLITGAASGIGLATAKMFCRLGACLALVDQDENGLKSILKKCRKIGCEPYGICGDLIVPEEVECIAKKTTERFGAKLDVLVNGAGILHEGTLQSTELECFSHVMDTNVKSAFHLSKLLLPQLLRSKGCIVNVSGVCGLRTFPDRLSYNMSQAAMDQFTRSMALDFGTKGLRVNSVNPGFICTNLHKASGMDDKTYASIVQSSEKSHALGRIGKPSEVASAICFLASPLASFVTGVTLPVDGGKQVMCPP